MSSDHDQEKGHKAAVDPHLYANEPVDEEVGIAKHGDALHKDLKSRHMQMIAIGGAIGAGLFISSGSALANGGPASLVICYLIVGIMLLFTMHALAEMAVLYPVNGAFYTYIVRFVDPSWGFAVGLDYAISWLTVLPFELTAASLTIRFWRDDVNVAVWITMFLVVLAIIQLFGVRGYGEVEFILSLIKICACTGFILFGIIYNCGGVGSQGYIGAKYWYDPGAFNNGFNGFAGVFSVAAFAFAGTELSGLAAAESANPRKAIPQATKQVFWRILFFYVINLLILGLVLPYNDSRLLEASSSSSRFSPFVLAIEDAGVKVLPHIFNAVITVSVISVANSCTYGSTRTLQAMAERGMAPKVLAYVDKHGRPIWCVALQLAFGLLAYIGVAGNQGVIFTWLLSLSGLSYFFVWGSICFAHIRFRQGWKHQGYNLQQLPYKAPLGIIGSSLGLLLNILAIMATFYTALYPTGDATPTADYFFEQFLAAPIILFLYLFWKLYSRDWRLFVRVHEMDLRSGARTLELDDEPMPVKTWKNLPMRVVHALV
ncbi:putative Amino acid permease [Seiridium cardinale]|uniref:Amino acid permease n=1 Tax=Seiridium cardinale TaxID=138064 RepID=A0ABR2XZ87_9PEZI